MKNLKSGITLSSLVIYIVLFSAFTVFVSTTYSNMNDNLLESRGKAINYASFNKLQENIEHSSIESESVVVTENSISYSNGDYYLYNNTDRCITKNGGILCTNVTEFTVSSSMLEGITKVDITVKFNKYLNELSRQIITCVEE